MKNRNLIMIFILAGTIFSGPGLLKAEEAKEDVVTVKVKGYPRPQIGFQLVPGIWVPFSGDLEKYYDFFPSLSLNGVIDLGLRTALAINLGYVYGEGNLIPGGSAAASRSYLNYFWLGQEIRFVRRIANWCRYYWGTGLRLVYMSERFREDDEGNFKTVGHNGLGVGWGLNFGADFFVIKSFTLGVKTDLLLLGGNDLSWKGKSYNLDNTGIWLGLTAGFSR
jgi:hypothetical protein